MKSIAIIFGGQSPEHDISILTGLHLVKHLSENYQPRLIYLTKDNQFLNGSRRIDDYLNGKAQRAKRFRDWNKISCVINCCHGGIGEDGRLSAFFQVLGIPVTSCDPRPAWELQSKIFTRQMLTSAGYRQPKFQVVSTLDLTSIKLPLPLVVKPEMLGSSIGVAVAKTTEELFSAVQVALQMGRRAIVEEYLSEMTEVNVAVRRERGKIVCSEIEVINSERFFSFAEKYENFDSGFVKKSSTNLDNKISDQVQRQVKELAIRAYELFGAKGIVRVDFMIQGEQVILNEVNTVPGFMAYHLWLKAGIPYGVLIDDLIKETLNEPKLNLITDFKSEVLQKNRQLVLENFTGLGYN